jgi:hypothetical protein
LSTFPPHDEDVPDLNFEIPEHSKALGEADYYPELAFPALIYLVPVFHTHSVISTGCGSRFPRTRRVAIGSG